MALTIPELTQYIDTGFKDEWGRRKTISLPAAGTEDRQLLFAAVARGVLQYLKDKEGELLSSMTTGSLAAEVLTMAIDKTVLNIDTQ